LYIYLVHILVWNIQIYIRILWIIHSEHVGLCSVMSSLISTHNYVHSLCCMTHTCCPSCIVYLGNSGFTLKTNQSIYTICTWNSYHKYSASFALTSCIIACHNCIYMGWYLAVYMNCIFRLQFIKWFRWCPFL
jgi:hypothetical protein